MTSIIKLEVISGGAGDEESGSCYILQVDEAKILLDAGWDENFSLSLIRRLNKHIKSIDAVLISHPDISHLGSLPYLVGKCGLNCPIYSTVPTCKMGEMFMYDLYASQTRYSDFDLFTLEDVDVTFSKITQVKYNQTISLSGRSQGIKVTPLPAGHMIGGTIWKILVREGEEDIIYAQDLNHKRERHLNGCSIESIIKPSLLIIDAYNANYAQRKRTKRDEELVSVILATLQNQGNVLIAVDTAGRSLELAYMLDSLWKSPRSELSAYNLALVNSVSTHVIELAKSQNEWMSDKIMKSFQEQRNNPFQLKCLKLALDLETLDKQLDPRVPKVVLASQPDLSLGFSRELLINWCSDPRNTLIITQRAPSTALSSQLSALASDKRDRRLQIEIFEKIPLQGLELEQYKLDKIREKRRQEEERLRDAEESDSDSDDDSPIIDADEDESRNFESSASKSALRKLKSTKCYPMFPCVEVRTRWDDYGELINAEDFIMFDQSKKALARDDEFARAQESSNKDAHEAALKIVADAEEEKLPTKTVSEVKTLNIRCNVSFIDFEGRSDGESLKKMISMMKPRRIIAVHGSYDSVSSLRSYCESIKGDAMIDKIFTPSVGQIVDATTETNIYQVKLIDSLVSSLHFSKSKTGLELAWIDGVLEKEEANVDVEAIIDGAKEENSKIAGDTISSKMAADKPIKQEISEATPLTVLEGGSENLSTLCPLPEDEVPGHVTIFVNELKLSDLKQILLKADIQAEFSGGVLYCSGDIVAVRRSEGGRILIEGTLCEDYFKIRNILYSNFAII